MNAPFAEARNTPALKLIRRPSDFIVAEHMIEFCKKWELTPRQQEASRLFGMLVRPTIGMTPLAHRHSIPPTQIGLKVCGREEVGIPFPAGDIKLTHTDAVEVDSFLDFVDKTMPTSMVWGLNPHSKSIFKGLAGCLYSQLEMPDPYLEQQEIS
jgi:hypothetical protein